MLAELQIRRPFSSDVVFINQLDELRDKVDHLDREVIEAIAARMKMIAEIGNYKKGNNVTIFQMEKWKEIIASRSDWVNKLNLSPDLILDIYKMIHE